MSEDNRRTQFEVLDELYKYRQIDIAHFIFKFGGVSPNVRRERQIPRMSFTISLMFIAPTVY